MTSFQQQTRNPTEEAGEPRGPCGICRNSLGRDGPVSHHCACSSPLRQGCAALGRGSGLPPRSPQSSTATLTPIEGASRSNWASPHPAGLSAQSCSSRQAGAPGALSARLAPSAFLKQPGTQRSPLHGPLLYNNQGRHCIEKTEEPQGLRDSPGSEGQQVPWLTSPSPQGGGLSRGSGLPAGSLQCVPGYST